MDKPTNDMFDDVFKNAFDNASEELPAGLVDSVMDAAEKADVLPNETPSSKPKLRIGKKPILSIAALSLIANAILGFLLFQKHDPEEIVVESTTVIHDTIYISKEIIKEREVVKVIKEPVGIKLPNQVNEAIIAPNENIGNTTENTESVTNKEVENKQTEKPKTNKDPHSLDYLMNNNEGIPLFEKR